MSFISSYAPKHWYPVVGEKVKGKSGHREFEGTVLSSKRKPNKPAVFSRWGYVGLYVETDNGKKVSINNVEPI